MFPSPGIGDIIAICTLIIKVGTVLCESREIPREYEELTRELNALYCLLQSVQTLYDPSLSFEAVLALQRIERQAKSCEEAMNDFLKNNSPPKSKTQKAVWAIRAPAKATSLRQKLSTHRQMLGIFLSEFRAQQQSDSLALCRREISVLRPTIETITVIDAVGNRMPMPFMFCRTYELLADTLAILFKHQELPGRSYVARGDYQLVHSHSRDIVAPLQWAFALSPDLIVEMSMVLRRRDQGQDVCPRCGTVFMGEASNGWASCLGCPGQFQIQHKQEATQSDTSVGSIAIPAQDGIREGPQISRRQESSEEWQKFRLLFIISLMSLDSHVVTLLPAEEERDDDDDDDENDDDDDDEEDYGGDEDEDEDEDDDDDDDDDTSTVSQPLIPANNTPANNTLAKVGNTLGMFIGSVMLMIALDLMECATKRESTPAADDVDKNRGKSQKR